MPGFGTRWDETDRPSGVVRHSLGNSFQLSNSTCVHSPAPRLASCLSVSVIGILA